MKKDSLKSMWISAKDEVRESKRYILAIFLLFLASAMIGFLFYNNLSFLDILLKEILSQVKDLQGPKLTFYILLNNSQSALFSMLLGVIFGVIPVFNAIFNGLVVGYVMAKVNYAEGFGQLWRILPHGIFELPAIFIALGLGLRIGASIFSKKGRNVLLKRVSKALIVFIFIVLPLLMIAAIIESLLISFYK